jgi:glycosyltransferase involved in cell wall biosynthesis
MKVLVVTNQLVKKVDKSFYCIENFYDIIRRFAMLGELCVCACRYTGKTSNVIDCKLTDFVEPQYIHLINKTIVRTDNESRCVIEQQVCNADLVIGYLPSTNGSTAWYYAKKYGKKYLSYVVGCPWDALWNHGICGKILAPRAFFYLRRILKNSDYALYVTERFLQKRYPCPGITCGCSDVRIVDQNDEILNKRLNRLNTLPENGIIDIATIAGYEVRYKGQHYVIKALAKLKKMGINRFRYHLIGSGNKKYLEELSKKLGVFDLVFFEGIVPHSRIFEKLDEMHIYIQPSLQEGLPRSVVEAMSRGLLCVCANTAAMPDMIEPEYVVERKSVDDIVNVLSGITVEGLKKQAIRNFNEAKKYQEENLDCIRSIFFEKIKRNCGSGNA